MPHPVNDNLSILQYDGDAILLMDHELERGKKASNLCILRYWVCITWVSYMFYQKCPSQLELKWARVNSKTRKKNLFFVININKSFTCAQFVVLESHSWSRGQKKQNRCSKKTVFLASIFFHSSRNVISSWILCARKKNLNICCKKKIQIFFIFIFDFFFRILLFVWAHLSSSSNSLRPCSTFFFFVVL